MGCNFYLCKKEFWNNFFSPQYSGVFPILVLALANTVYTCAVVLMSTYYDNFSHTQHIGYLTLMLAHIIVTVAGFLSIHFLTLKAKNTTLTYCLALHVAFITAILLGIVSVTLMLTPPTPHEVMDHTKRYVKIYHRAPYMMRGVFREKQCCGIQRFGDIFIRVEHTERVKKSGNMWENVLSIFFRIPPVCCKETFRRTCTNWTSEVVSRREFKDLKDKYLNREACLDGGETFSALQNTNTYAIYLRTVSITVGVFIFAIGILLILSYYIWYRFPRMPPGQRPDQFLEDLRAFIRCKYHQVKKSIDEIKQREAQDREAIMEPKRNVNRSEFAIRHEAIMRSIQNMKTLNKELKTIGHQERAIQLPKSRSNLMLPGASVTSSLGQGSGNVRRDYLRPPSRANLTAEEKRNQSEKSKL